MTLTQIARKARTVVFAGLAALATTTFQNGCAYGIPGNSLNSLLNSLSDYYDSESYSSGSDGYYTDDPFHGWEFADVKSG